MIKETSVIMTLDEKIQKFGAKGAVLNYIRETDPSIPIEPFVLVPVGADWREYRSQITELGDCLVRSSSPAEDGKRVSFAGLFNTVKFSRDDDPNYVLESVNDKDVLDYARIHGVNGPIEMGLIFHKNSKSDMNWGILRHPHIPELLFIMGTGKNIFGGTYTDDYIYNERMGILQEVFDYNLSKVYGRERDTGELPHNLAEAVDIYKKIELMPEFQTGYTYHMEFGTSPFSVYQFRPFRKKEVADWNLATEDGIIGPGGSAICFGITPPEGLELTLVRALSAHEQSKFIDYSARSKLRDLSYDKIVERLMKKWPLSEQERVYAEQVAGLDPNISGSNEDEAFGKALSELNRRVKKEETYLFQEDMHFYYGRDIDLVFPNAKVWAPYIGVQFLSHKWFRAMQHYDIVLAGSAEIYSKTGDKVKVYSDGIKGKVVELQKEL